MNQLVLFSGLAGRIGKTWGFTALWDSGGEYLAWFWSRRGKRRGWRLRGPIERFVV